MFCRVSLRCTEKRSLRISSSHLDRRRNYACHDFSRDAQIPVMLSGFAGCGRRARGRSECPSCIQICRLCSYMCFVSACAVQRNPEIRVLIAVIAAPPYTYSVVFLRRCGGRISSSNVFELRFLITENNITKTMRCTARLVLVLTFFCKTY